MLVCGALLARRMRLLEMGDDTACALGVRVERSRLLLMLVGVVLTAAATALAGPISFIALVAPHIARLVFGEDHRFYLPASALIGALVLSLASVAAKNLIPGAVIPVGIVTSLVGVPFFLSIILRHRGHV